MKVRRMVISSWRRMLVVEYTYDRGKPWRWTVPLGHGPRWLRQAWCLAFHWRKFKKISDTECGSERRAYGIWSRVWGIQAVVPKSEDLETIVIYGCYNCQFAWWREISRTMS